MNKNLRLLFIIPLIAFFLSIIIVFFSPLKIIPCETSTTNPATSWNKDNCKGYYLTINQQPEQVDINNSGFLINLVILTCGSFLVNGIIFLLLFIFVVLKENKVPGYREQFDETQEEEIVEPRVTKMRRPLAKIFNGEKENVDMVEIPSGASRINNVKKSLRTMFKRKPKSIEGAFEE
ncbi:MAG: hypothetical protein ABI721_03165 [Candidatus Dojkabacteria bacterium]